jgi:hypothetical protein
LKLTLKRNRPNLVESVGKPLSFKRCVSQDNKSVISEVLRKNYFSILDFPLDITGLNEGYPNNICGHYLVVSKGKYYHLSIKPLSDHVEAKIVYNITKTLLEYKVLVPFIYLTDKGKDFALLKYKDCELCFILSNYIKHCVYDGSKEYFLEIARSLSKLHDGLRRMKLTDIVRKRSVMMRKEAKAAKNFICCLLVSRKIEDVYELAGWVRGRWKVLEMITEEFEPSFFDDDSNSQPIHGDLHPGNIGFVDGKTVFFDFEAATYNFLPVSVDIVNVVFRLNIFRKDNGFASSFSITDFMKTYSASEGLLPESITEMKMIWKQLLYDNLCRSIYACNQRRYLDSEEELDKFCTYLFDTDKLCIE